MTTSKMAKPRIRYKPAAHGQIATEYALLLVLVAMLLFASVDDVSLLSLLLDAIRQLNYHYIVGMGFSATPI